MIKMLYFAFLLLLFFNFSLEDILYTDFPLNSEFNILNEETGKDILIFMLEIL